MPSINKQNFIAWSGNTYAAWVNRYGRPANAVLKLRKDPTVVIHPIQKYMGDIPGKRIVNIMGSNGVKALALAMLGADITIIDFSPSNAKYARELAKEARLNIHYVVSDILEVPVDNLTSDHDIVFAELGIVHYFDDLLPLMSVVHRLLSPGGRFILRDFHPISTKLISSRGTTAKIRKHKVTGNYFDRSLELRPVSFTKHLSENADKADSQVAWRKWTLGEIVTAVASADLYIKILDEEPNPSGFDGQFPKTFTLVAERPKDSAPLNPS